MRRVRVCAGGSTLVIVGIERNPPSASAARAAGHGDRHRSEGVARRERGELAQRPAGSRRSARSPSSRDPRHRTRAGRRTCRAKWGYGSSRNESPNGSKSTTSISSPSDRRTARPPAADSERRPKSSHAAAPRRPEVSARPRRRSSTSRVPEAGPQFRSSTRWRGMPSHQANTRDSPSSLSKWASTLLGPVFRTSIVKPSCGVAHTRLTDPPLLVIVALVVDAGGGVFAGGRDGGTAGADVLRGAGGGGTAAVPGGEGAPGSADRQQDRRRRSLEGPRVGQPARSWSYWTWTWWTWTLM